MCGEERHDFSGNEKRTIGEILTRGQIGQERWDAFCYGHPGAWFWWTSSWLEYQIARGEKQDLSFGIVHDDIIVALCPLLVEERDGFRTFTMEGHPGPWPLTSPVSSKHGEWPETYFAITSAEREWA